jgi:hypothetical protein
LYFILFYLVFFTFQINIKILYFIWYFILFYLVFFKNPRNCIFQPQYFKINVFYLKNTLIFFKYRTTALFFPSLTVLPFVSVSFGQCQRFPFLAALKMKKRKRKNGKIFSDQEVALHERLIIRRKYCHFFLFTPLNFSIKKTN